jgi:GTP-binding protein HflX
LFVEDRLFATLDSYTRTVYLSDGKNILLTDTVGFIRNLPMHLIDSFRSTLEEIQHAQFLIHVIDLTANDVTTNIATVENEMVRLEASGKPTISFFNKSDLVTDESRINIIKTRYPDAIIGSAAKNEGINELKNRLLYLLESQVISC